MINRLKEVQGWLYAKARSLRIDLYIMLGLLILLIAGVAFTDAFEKFSHTYWLAMVPVFFTACLYIEWSAAQKSGTPVPKLVINQLLHWGGLFVAVNVVYLLRQIGSLDNETTGLSLLLIFALGTYMAGVTAGLMFRLLGGFLGLSLVMAAYTEHYIWVTIGFALMILIGYSWVLRNIQRMEHSELDKTKQPDS